MDARLRTCVQGLQAGASVALLKKASQQVRVCMFMGCVMCACESWRQGHGGHGVGFVVFSMEHPGCGQVCGGRCFALHKAMHIGRH
jgi:hypothetical protein